MLLRKSLLSAKLRQPLWKRFMSSQATQSKDSSIIQRYATAAPISQKAKPYLDAPHPQLDLKAYKSTTKFVMIWVFSLSLFAGVCGVFGYSLWWQLQREQARLDGRDLDEWLLEFEKQDPVVLKMKQWGIQPDTASELQQHLNK